jgi:hypothetical protein
MARSDVPGGGSKSTGGDDVTRVFSKSSTPLTLWLLLVLAVALLVNISTTAVARSEESARPRDAAAVGDVDRGLGALRALTERIDRPAPIIPAAYTIHPSIGDGSPAFLGAATDRLISMVARRLSRLAADVPGGGPRAVGLAALLAGLHELPLRRIALDAAADPEDATRRRVEAETILHGMQLAWAELEGPARPDGETAPPAVPTILRGSEL